MAQYLTPRWAVDGVKIEDVSLVWKEAWPYLKRAIDRFPNRREQWDENRVLSRMALKTLQMWIAWDYERDAITGAVATEIHPEHCSIALIGGDQFHQWGDAMWILLKRWTLAQGRNRIVIAGRPGWKRLYGFVDCGTTDDGLPLYVRTLKETRP